MLKLIDGKALSAQLRSEIKEEVEKVKAKGITPGLAVILVGDDPASQVYVRNKEKACIAAGMHSEVYRLPQETSEEELLARIDKLNKDDNIHGILVQLPVPKHINEDKIIDAISVDKDVDGFSPANVGALLIGKEAFEPCTPCGCIELIKTTGIEISGKKAVVVGRSNIVGKPIAIMLLRENATVTICHSRTKDLKKELQDADIIVAAVGKADQRDFIRDTVAVGILFLHGHQVVVVFLQRGGDFHAQRLAEGVVDQKAIGPGIRHGNRPERERVQRAIGGQACGDRRRFFRFGEVRGGFAIEVAG